MIHQAQPLYGYRYGSKRSKLVALRKMLSAAKRAIASNAELGCRSLAACPAEREDSAWDEETLCLSAGECVTGLKGDIPLFSPPWAMPVDLSLACCCLPPMR